MMGIARALALRAVGSPRPDAAQAAGVRIGGRIDPAWLGVWLGIVFGLAEVAMILVVRWASGKVTSVTLTTNHHYFWMIPLANAALLGTAGLLLAPVARLGRRPAAGRACVLVLCVLAAYGLALLAHGLHRAATLALAAGVGWRLAAAIGRHPAGFRRLALNSLPAGVLAMAALAVGGSWRVGGAEGRMLAALPEAAPGAPNVLLVVLDTVRADALNRATMPRLTALSQRGVRFDRARSPASWTLPAHASLFTGRWPHELAANAGVPLDDADPTIAEALAGRGYATVAFMANTHNTNAWYGLDRGFARYEDLYENREVSAVEVFRGANLGRELLGLPPIARLLFPWVGEPRRPYRKTGAMVNRDLLAWLPKRGDRPFFAVLNYYDAHDPFVVPPGADRPFTRAAEASGRPRSPLEVARDDYDDCLRSLDDQVGRLVDALEMRELMDQTMLIVTSDHGESFGGHDVQGHGASLYGPELDVPLVIVLPSGAAAGRSVAEPVSTRDLAATILDLLGRDGDLPGTSLARSWRSYDPVGTGAGMGPVLAHVDRTSHTLPPQGGAPALLGPMFAVIDGRLKLIRNGDGREELYDLNADPDETVDLAGSPAASADLARLRATLSRMTLARDDTSPPVAATVSGD